MGIAGAYGNPVIGWRDRCREDNLLWREPVNDIAVAQLAEFIAAPNPERPIAAERYRVKQATGQHRPVACSSHLNRAGNSRGGQGIQRDLSAEIVPPGPERSIGTTNQGVLT